MWLIPFLLLTLIAGGTLGATIAHSGDSPIARIATATAAFAATLAALAATGRAQHPKQQSRSEESWRSISVWLTALAVVLLLFSWIFIELTGPT